MLCRRLLLLLLLLLTGCLSASPVRHYGDFAIEADTVWKGTIRIAGVVTVKKGARLTIMPGTRVLFERIDRDGDGIGDAEIYVEGELVAEGTADAPILLTSAAPRPKPADWKYLYCDFARKVRVAHLISEYAYSGIQVHFCKAHIRASEFRYNVDGVRFSTVNLQLAGSNIHHNRHGLRYEERRSRGEVRGNRIHDNDINIFVVTRSRGDVLVTGNDITDSGSYQVKFGLQQRQEVVFPRNWWGTTDAAQLASAVFDRRRDPSLGRALLEAPLPGPVFPVP